jgi:polyisoprenoid-binding protein YceI
MGWIAIRRSGGVSFAFRRSLASVAAALLLGAAPPLGAQHRVAPSTVATGTLSFDGKATTGDFTGTTAAVTGEMTGGASVAEVTGFVEAPVATLVTGNGRRDRDLNKSMESAKFPTIRFDLTSVAPGAEAADSGQVTLVGEFTIHGVKRPASIPATVRWQADTVQVVATAPMNLKDYSIGGLSKFLGVLKMNPDIVVHVDLTFRPK